MISLSAHLSDNSSSNKRAELETQSSHDDASVFSVRQRLNRKSPRRRSFGRGTAANSWSEQDKTKAQDIITEIVELQEEKKYELEKLIKHTDEFVVARLQADNEIGASPGAAGNNVQNLSNIHCHFVFYFNFRSNPFDETSFEILISARTSRARD